MNDRELKSCKMFTEEKFSEKIKVHNLVAASKYVSKLW